MSQMSSKRCSTPSFVATFSAWRREPLVKIRRRPGSAAIAAASSGNSGTTREIDVVHVVEKRTGRQLVDLHQPGERGAELAVVGLLQMPRVLEGNADRLGDVVAHALVDLGKEIARAPG